MLRIGRLALAGVLLVLLWQVADGPAAARLLAAADPAWLAAAAAALTAQTLLSALRWRLVAAQLGIRLGLREAVAEYYLSQAVNQALPGGMAGDAGRAFRSRGEAGLLASGQAVVFERLAGQVAMFAVLAVAFATTLAVPGGLDWPGWLLAPVAALLAAGAALPGAVLLAVRVLPGSLGAGAARVARAAGRALFAPGIRLRQIGLSLGTALCNIAAFACAAAAVGASLPLPAALALVPLVLLAMVVPLGFGGWGLREGAAAALLPLAGTAPSEALAASVAFGLVFLGASVPGLAAVVGRNRPEPAKSALPASEPAAPPCQAAPEG
jgi:uncharacterized membrane protein YbhN (UPF0104 family)